MLRFALMFFALLAMGACSSTTTTTSTGETSSVSIDEVFSEADRTGPSGAATTNNAGDNLAAFPGIDQESFEDFEAFQSWLRARQPGTSEFAEFQLWREYLEYIRVTTQ